MSQRRQDARRSKQERQREARHQARAAQRRSSTVTAPQRVVAPPPRSTFWTTRNRWIIFGGVAAIIVVAIAAWIIINARAPLPGQKFESQGNDHLANIDEPHPPYNSNPPTSGWHLLPLPRPGIYTQPRRPEEQGHFMEHGGVWVLYNCPEGCPEAVEQLQRIVNDAIDRNKPVALAPFPSMEARFATTAWQYLQTYDTVDEDAIENFISRLACNYNPEGPGYCPATRGSIKTTEPNRETTTATATPFSVFGSATPVPSGAASPSPTPSR
jgi:hypothetical protein